MSLAAFLAAGFAFEARACGEGARRAGDRRRLVAGIGGHWRALAGIGGRGGGGDFGEIRGRSFRHACWAWGVAFVGRSGFACRRADEPTSRRADEPTSRRADEPTSRRADEPTSRHADEPTSRRADEPTSRHADGSTVPSVYESIPVSPMQSRRLADSPIHRFTDLPIYRFTDSPAHAARRCRGPAARSVRSSAPAFIPPRHDGRPPSPGRSKPHGGAAISAAHRAPPPSIPSKLTAVVSHEFFSCLS
ncbi:Probable hemoglobin and hemoglobin-haptoglobin-binding protein 3 precursor [Burkholderia pseudomallei]|nr:Probable hemoglobin and hemoglobin-haptoglobin-binding protein 3 precursor [Burkholderia pseudomallei]